MTLGRRFKIDYRRLEKGEISTNMGGIGTFHGYSTRALPNNHHKNIRARRAREGVVWFRELPSYGGRDSHRKEI